MRYGHCKISEQQLDNILFWEFDPNYGIVKNVGTNACWSVASVSRRNEQFLRLATCNETDPSQQFYPDNGRIHIKQEPRLCLGFDYSEFTKVHDVKVVSFDCYREIEILNANSAFLNFKNSDYNRISSVALGGTNDQ